jgi:tight adherence protein B
MGAVLGLAVGLGLVLLMLAVTDDGTQRSRPARRHPLDDLLADAGVRGVRPAAVVGVSVAVGLAVAVLFLGLSRTWPIAVAFGLLAATSPVAALRYRARQRRTELRELWPDVVDNLASSVRAGRSLPDAVSQVGERGPEPLRPAFQRFAEDYRVSGRFHDALDDLKDRLADPTGDRIVESLRIARDVGGGDLGRVLRTLSAFLREEARARAELETRQSWVVNAARLAVASPWILLAMLSLRTTAVQAYQAPAGIAVLVGGLAASLVAYRLMLQLGRLPEDARVLR